MNHAINFGQDSETKAKIFTVAARLMSQKGYNGVSMREISEQSGVSKPTIYYYFNNKEGLYQALVDVGLTQGDAQITEVLRQNIPAKQKLIELVKIRFRQSIEYPDFVKFFLHLYLALEDVPFVHHFRKEANRKRQLLIDLIRDGIAKKEFGISVKPELAVEIISGTISHFLWQQLGSKAKILSDQLAEEIIEVLFKGFNE